MRKKVKKTEMKMHPEHKKVKKTLEMLHKHHKKGMDIVEKGMGKLDRKIKKAPAVSSRKAKKIGA